MTDEPEGRGGRDLIKVWDPVVRIGHWILVAGFATAYLTEGEPQWLHTWAGYAVAVTVVLRVVWGFVGPERARFANFVVGPSRALAYLRELVGGTAPRHVGHSPAGGLMTVTLLAALAGTTWTGMQLYAVEANAGPLAPWYGSATAASEAAQLVPPAHADEDERDAYGEFAARGDGGECCDARFLLHLRLESGPRRGPDDETIEVQRGADRGDPAGAGSRIEDR